MRVIAAASARVAPVGGRLALSPPSTVVLPQRARLRVVERLRAGRRGLLLRERLRPSNWEDRRGQASAI